uniref:Scarecrow-like protein 32 n=1 Tax=Cajanus cajan TaxID=3821 RepID=A0A151SK84_CAJCA|nr:Scarecrow-like protein 32 [Cajanus cajan]
MTQFTPSFHQIAPIPNPTMNKNQIPRTRPWPAGFPTSKALTNFGDANCMEQLLIHCANAIETNDVTLAQQILWVLNNIAPPDGDSNQRLASSFLRALTARAAKTGTCNMLVAVAAADTHNNDDLTMDTHKFSVIELANFVDLTPWHRFGFTAANAAVLEATEGFSVIHIVDLSLTHCMQIPTLIDAVASRHDVPPLIKLTVADASFRDIPPMLDLSYDELGAKLVNFARSRNVVMEFRVVSSSYQDGFADLTSFLYDSSSAVTSTSSLRSLFLKSLRGLDPTVVILVDEDANLTSNNLVCRLRSAFNYLWIPYDTVDTFLPRGSKQRQWYEADIGWKIENVIAHEGVQRVERVEPKNRWEQRMKNASFQAVAFSEDSVAEVKAMLDEHAAGWGLKKEDEHIVLTWKGHNVVFASAWLPA